MVRTRIRVSGTVQGVGFRPFVYRHAVALGLTGSVRNDSDGVLIDAQGDAAGIAELGRLLVDEPPPLARISSLTVEEAEPSSDLRAFRIVETDDAGAPNVPVSVDVATCPACLAEVDDPGSRRFGYAFTNCTDCGPRYTIVQSVPYDRPATTMAAFTMCSACQAEYDDPGDRRFHAQPNACPACGPTVVWREPGGSVLAHGAQAVAAAVDALRGGAIVAVKGIGGFHLAADATDPAAVGELRRRKHRDDKPFAVLVGSLAQAREIAEIDAASEAALTSNRRPIVLVPRRTGSAVAGAVAPGLPELGLLLPYSPLHHLLSRGVGRPLVLTSGNLSDEPIAHEDGDAGTRLGPLVDGILGHDRPIHIRCDDSVARSTRGRFQLLRRSRSYAPEPMVLPVPASVPLLAVGGELKSTISVAKGRMVVASHHIGDLEHLATYRSFLQAVEHVAALYGVEPEVVACDLHPEYLSSKFAADLGLPVVAVQHHHAHVASCLVEHRRIEPVVALAFDGLGYGIDGSLWGGEVLVADLHSSERVAHLREQPMPGGTRAIREPWRMAAVWGGARALVFSAVVASEVEAVLAVAASGQAPMTTSVGRLFDAVAALLGCRQSVTYEGQAAIELEALARRVDRADVPDFSMVIDGDVLDPTDLVARLVAERDRGADRALLAAAFHESLGRAAADLATQVAGDRGIDAVVLTGGVFQNARFTEVVEDALVARELAVLVHSQIPANDGGISIGQAAVAAARLSS